MEPFYVIKNMSGHYWTGDLIAPTSSVIELAKQFPSVGTALVAYSGDAFERGWKQYGRWTAAPRIVKVVPIPVSEMRYQETEVTHV